MYYFNWITKHVRFQTDWWIFGYKFLQVNLLFILLLLKINGFLSFAVTLILGANYIFMTSLGLKIILKELHNLNVFKFCPVLLIGASFDNEIAFNLQTVMYDTTWRWDFITYGKTHFKFVFKVVVQNECARTFGTLPITLLIGSKVISWQ